jgi:hypothetical protein
MRRPFFRFENHIPSLALQLLTKTCSTPLGHLLPNHDERGFPGGVGEHRGLGG